MIDLCVINYNTKEKLDRFLYHLHSDVTPFNKNWNLYIADNGSSDDSQVYLKEISSKTLINKVYLNDNIGYSAACNQLAADSTGEIIGLLNADVWMTTEDIVNIEKVFNDNPDIHILGPKQRDENGFITHAGIIGSNTQPRHRGWRNYDPSDVLFRDRVECVTVSGSAYFIKRDVWNALWNDPEYRAIYPDATGAFLPTPHYYEETWCSYFARHRGYKIYYDGSVSIGHSWHSSSPKPGEGFSEADAKFPISREIFRKACDIIGIERD